MTKFDHAVNLPKVFRKNKLTILPVTRSRYVIGRFNCYKGVDYTHNQEHVEVNFPSDVLQSIDYQNLYSESSALHCAFVCGMIDDILGEPAYFTVSGRMSSKDINFDIDTIDGKTMPLHIKNAQIEIDAGFESKNYFMVIEAKRERVEDFIIRQLYYPFRLWKEKLNKTVLPVFFTYSNDVFSFFIYNFKVLHSYNSLSLVGQRNYVIGHEPIGLDDIHTLFIQTKCVPEPKIPFPQADELLRVVDLIGLLAERDLTKEDITLNYAFTSRQTSYYTNAAIYLGLVEKYVDSGTDDISYTLTKAGRKILSMPYKRKYLTLASAIIQHRPFYEVLKAYFSNGVPPTKSEVVTILKDIGLYEVRSNSTFERRAQTVIKWVNWILDLSNPS